MVTTQTKLTEIFKQGAGIYDDEESVLFGGTHAPYVPAGVEAVMQFHTQEVDLLLQKLQKGSIEEMELFTTRGFTMQEYEALFDLNIREKDFIIYPAFRSLWIVTDSQRRKVIYSIQKQKFNDYWLLLASCLSRFNPSLISFFFRTQIKC